MNVSRKSFNLKPIIICALYITAAIGLSACGNEGPLAPEDITNPFAPATPGDLNSGAMPFIDRGDTPGDITPDSPLIPAIDLSGTTIYNLAAAMFYLQESGGGVLSVPIEADQVAVHVWDPSTGMNLEAQAVIVCSGGPTTLLDINGYQVFEGATFPVTVTVYSEGYAMTTFAGTTANVLSFALAPAAPPMPAFVFGMAENYGCDSLQVYSDTLLPEYYIANPSEINPDYTRYEHSIEAETINGFTAFLTGNLDMGIIETKGPASPEDFFWIAPHFEWEITGLKSGDRRFIPISFGSKAGPSGIAEGTVSVPAPYWTEGQKTDGLNAMLPTAIFLEARRYLAIGPYIPLDGEDPGNLSYEAPYFEPVLAPDRIVMAGHMVLVTGEIDIVHRDWHPGYNPADISFTGFPSLVVTGGPGAGFTYPAFSWTDPLGVDGTLTRIEMASGSGSWHVTQAGNGGSLDSSDLAIPLTWFDEIFDEASPRYRVECIKSYGQSIDDFNEDQLIMMKGETCFSNWVGSMP